MIHKSRGIPYETSTRFAPVHVTNGSVVSCCYHHHHHHNNNQAYGCIVRVSDDSHGRCDDGYRRYPPYRPLRSRLSFQPKVIFSSCYYHHYRHRRYGTLHHCRWDERIDIVCFLDWSSAASGSSIHHRCGAKGPILGVP